MIVYLTGGIGTGKSTVLSMFSELGARTLCADDIVRELYREPAVQQRVAEALRLPVPLDKQAVAELVFADSDARTTLEHVLHPLVRGVSDRAFAQVADDDLLVYEIPLPPEPRCGDVVCAVTAPLPTRVARLVARGMTEADARARIAAQPAEAVYGKHASHIIVNDGDEAALREAVRVIWEELRRGTGPV